MGCKGIITVRLTANEIDVHVGARLRERREALGLSQGKLGQHLGLTFSQIQKYEKGSNRIGAGRLFQIAEFLRVPVTYFFLNLDGQEEPAEGANATPTSAESRALTAAFGAIRDPETRASTLALVRSLAAEETFHIKR